MERGWTEPVDEIARPPRRLILSLGGWEREVGKVDEMGVREMGWGEKGVREARSRRRRRR